METQTLKTNTGENIQILKEHIRNKSAGKKARGKSSTVCVSSVLSFFGITPDKYRHSWNSKAKNPRVYLSILRRNGFGVANRYKHFKSCKTVNNMTDSMEYFIDPLNRRPGATPITVYYIIRVYGHVFVMDSAGNICIDTAPREKKDFRRLYDVNAVYVKQTPEK